MENTMFTKCLEFSKAFLENDVKFSFHVETSDGFKFRFDNKSSPGPGTPGSKFIRKSPSQLKRNRLRMEKFLEKKKSAVEAGVPEQVPDRNGGEIIEKHFDENIEKATYEIHFEAPNCLDSEVMECFKANYIDELKCNKVFGEDTKYEIDRSDTKHVIKKIDDVMTSLQIFEVVIPNKPDVRKVIELFTSESMFDHEAFKNAVKGKKFVKLRKIGRIK